MSESKDLAMKNAYSNYDDHCTVVVAIEYAFFEGVFVRGNHVILSSWGVL